MKKTMLGFIVLLLAASLAFAGSPVVVGGGGTGSMTYPDAGIAVSTGSAWDSPAAYTNVVGLWTTCTGYLKSDGTCDTPAGYTNLTSFVAQTAWRLFYSNADGDVTELVLGAAGTFLRSGGASTDPAFAALPVPTTITVADSTDATTFVALFEDATGDRAPKTDAGLTYAADTGMLSATGITVGSGGITTAASSDPTITLKDSDNAAGTAKIFGNSSGGANDIILSIGVEDSTGESTVYIEVDGVTETIDLLKPVVASGAVTANAGITVGNGATTAGFIYFNEDSSNGTNTAQLIGPASTDDVVITLPAATGTVALVKNEKLASFAWDNGASAVATSGSKRCVAIPYAATIAGYTMVISGDPGAGGTILNITKDAWSDSALPTTEIDASAPPTVADDKVAATDSTLTDWTKTVAANDIICADVATNAVATWISLTIFGTK